jgi:tetratricopeptide (TPR) repeat protein
VTRRAPPATALGLAALAAFAAACAGGRGGEDRGGDALGDGLAALAALAETSAPDADPATLDLLVAPDAAFLRRHGAASAEVLRGAVAAADRVLAEATGARVRVGGAALFRATPGVRDDLRLLREARLQFLPGAGGCEVTAAFTGEACGERAGVAEPRRRLLLCADAADPERNLVHEAAHLFGAIDLPRGHPGYASPSVMSYDASQPRTLGFDPMNREGLRARAGRLPPRRDDPVEAALAAREARAGVLGPAWVGAFLCAASRRSQDEGVAPAERLVAALPGDPAAAWLLGECLRFRATAGPAWERLGDAAAGIATAAAPDGLDRHAALEAARAAAGSGTGPEGLRPAADAALERAAAAFPGDAEILEARGLLRAAMGDAAAAAGFLRDATAADPWTPSPWLGLAALARDAGDGEAWEAAFAEALARHGPDPVLEVRRVREGLALFPERVLRPGAVEEHRRLLARAAAWYPGWEEARDLASRTAGR